MDLASRKHRATSSKGLRGWYVSVLVCVHKSVCADSGMEVLGDLGDLGHGEGLGGFP